MLYRVIVDVSSGALDRFFDYSSTFQVPLGSRVKIPFGNRIIEGYVIEEIEKTDYKTKDIISILDPYPIILPEMLHLSKFLTDKNLRYIDCLRLCIPSKLRAGTVRELVKNFISLNTEIDLESYKELFSKTTRTQSYITLLDRLIENGAFENVLVKEGFSQSTIKTLISKGILNKTREEIRRLPRCIVPQTKNITLTQDQCVAIDSILNSSGTFLLHGVTGSGKTEIYMTIINKMLSIGKTAIMLVPEISLTPQMLGVFRDRFGDDVSVLHSGLSAGERYDEWRRLRLGLAKVALGARSAIFAPIENIGAIIIDEEHEGSYTSETNPRYFTSEIASFRAKYNDAKLILGSATPSIDSYLKAVRGEYTLVTLKTRINDRKMPKMEIVDMRIELRNGNVSLFSKSLLLALDDTLQAKNQAMIFINRRGYASFIRCRSCGYVAMCSDCDVSLTYHREEERLKCHYCGKQFHALTRCPVCGFEGLKEGSVGTEKVVAELNRIFPTARILRMDNDTTLTKDAYLEILSSFAAGEADILVGTQMIAKGHDFKNVTLVGILDADQSLYFSDYMCNERTFQLITQVAGRAGREHKEGRVIMQTYNPKHYVFRFASNYDYCGFFDKESNSREVTKFPPYSQMVRILIAGKDENDAIIETRDIYTKIKEIKANCNGRMIRSQAMRAPIKRVENNYRFQIVLLLIPNSDIVLQEIYKCAVSATNKVSVFIELNPRQLF
ncbi:MAG: primosomal protein N' [Christensenellaceae bacterium]|nr:primosomal protein N' [Christensenellaceae bacterium]